MAKTKKVTRRQAKAWLLPMRRCFAQMLTGYADSVRGHIVTRLHNRDEYAHVEHCIAGFIGLIERVFHGQDQAPLEKLQKRIGAGVMLESKDLHAAMALLNIIEDRLITLTVADLKHHAQAEIIAIEFEKLAEAA